MADIAKIWDTPISNVESILTITKVNNMRFVGEKIVVGGGDNWHSHFDNTEWEAFQGWWDGDNLEWDSNGWECVLHVLTAPYGTKIRITFTGSSPLTMSVRNDGGTETYASDTDYTSGKEIDFTVTDTWGRLYFEGGSFSITNIELYYT
jgi:hypothetical protein